MLSHCYISCITISRGTAGRKTHALKNRNKDKEVASYGVNQCQCLVELIKQSLDSYNLSFHLNLMAQIKAKITKEEYKSSYIYE